MRPDALRAATAQAAVRSTTKLATRLSKGEKRNRKRMAEVGGVYDVEPVPRTPDDILPDSHISDPHAARPAPHARDKWLIASVEEDAAAVVSLVFGEAERRDPRRHRTWVAPLLASNHLIAHIKTESGARQADVTIV